MMGTGALLVHLLCCYLTGPSLSSVVDTRVTPAICGNSRWCTEEADAVTLPVYGNAIYNPLAPQPQSHLCFPDDAIQV